MSKMHNMKVVASAMINKTISDVMERGGVIHPKPRTHDGRIVIASGEDAHFLFNSTLENHGIDHPQTT